MRTLLALTVLSLSLTMTGCSSSDSAETESLDKDAENTASESGATAVRIGVLNRTKIYAALGLADEYRRRHQSINEIVQKEINRLTNQLKSMQQQYVPIRPPNKASNSSVIKQAIKAPISISLQAARKTWTRFGRLI